MPRPDWYPFSLLQVLILGGRSGRLSYSIVVYTTWGFANTQERANYHTVFSPLVLNLRCGTAIQVDH